jgi:PEP-CTERM motif
MKSNTFHLIAASGLFTIGAAQGATIFTSQATFLSAITGSIYTEAFTATAPPNYLGGGLGYNVSTGTGVAGKVYNSGAFIGTIDQTTFTLNFTTGNILAVGGNFYVTDIADVFTAASTTVTLSDGTSDTFTPSSTTEFRGYVATTALTSLTMSGTSGGVYNTVDNITVSGIPVPEPGSAGLLGFGVLGLGLRRRRA